MQLACHDPKEAQGLLGQHLYIYWFTIPPTVGFAKTKIGHWQA